MEHTKDKTKDGGEEPPIRITHIVASDKSFFDAHKVSVTTTEKAYRRAKENPKGIAKEAFALFDDSVAGQATGALLQELGAIVANFTEGDIGEGAIEKARRVVDFLQAERNTHNYTAQRLLDDIINYDESKVFRTELFGREDIGFKQGNLSVICARSSVGKSIALNNLCLEALAQNRNVVYFTLEELPRQVFEHLILRNYYGAGGREAKASDIRRVIRKESTREEINAGEVKRIRDAVDFMVKKLESGALHILDANEAKDIGAMIRALTNEGDVVLIDYSQIVYPVNGSNDRFARVENASRELTAIAKKAGVILITAAQANRKQAGERNKESGISVDDLEPENIRDSDALFQDADIAIGIGAEDSWSGEPLKGDKETRRFFRIYKNRQGRRNQTRYEMDFEPEYSFLQVARDSDGERIIFEPTEQPVEKESKSTGRKGTQKKAQQVQVQDDTLADDGDFEIDGVSMSKITTWK